MGLDFNKLRDRINSNGKNTQFKKINWFNLPKTGASKFAIITKPEESAAIAWHGVFIHYGFIDSDGKKRAYKCSKNKFGSCPICEQYYKLKVSGEEGDLADKQSAEEIRPQFRALYYVLDSANLEPKVLSAKPLQKDLIDAELMNAANDISLDITNMETLRFIRLTRMSAKPWASARYLTEAIELTPEKKKQIIDDYPALDKLFEDHTPEQLLKMMNGEEINKNSKVNKKEVEEEQTIPRPSTVTESITNVEEDDLFDAEPIKTSIVKDIVEEPKISESVSEKTKINTKAAEILARIKLNKNKV